jgi:hypothetical protein
VVLGDPAATQDFILTNSPSTTVDLVPEVPDLLGPNADQYSITGDDCPASLAPGDNCTITVSFDPTSLGGKAARLVVDSNDPSGPTQATLFGTGTAIDQTIFPTSIAFGPQLRGTTSSRHTVTLTNGPGASSSETIGQVSLVGADNGQFLSGSDGCSGTTLAPGDSCQISIAFAPTNTGEAAASLSIPSSAPTSPATVALSGTGTLPDQDVSPVALAFGSQPVGVASSTQAVTVANSADGSGPLQVGAVSLGGAAASQFDLVFDGCSGRSLSPGDDCQIGVRFAPSAQGSQAASIQIPSNGSVSPVGVTLTGSGVAAPTTNPTPAPPAPNCKGLRAKLKKAKSKKQRKALRKKLRKRGC